MEDEVHRLGDDTAGTPLALEHRVSQVQGEAFERIASKGEFSVSEMLELSVEVHKFSFQSQLTSNIADKSSRGIQQLFRQKA